MPRHFKVHDSAYPHFMTSTIVHWIPVFCREEHFKILADSLTHCCESKGLLVHGYVIMPNHFHLLASQDEGLLTDTMRDLKGYVSRVLKPLLIGEGRDSWVSAMESAGGQRSDFALWQEGFHPEQVYSGPFFQQKLDYIHSNPVRAGFVNDPCEWRYSSAGFYLRENESLLPITPVEW